MLKKEPILLVYRSDVDAKLPTKNNKEDMCYDIYCITDEEFTPHDEVDFIVLMPGDRKVFRTGIKLSFPENFSGHLRERSGLASKGIQVLGGCIDNGYHGEIKVVLYNSSNEMYTVMEGDKICQMKLEEDFHFPIAEVDNELELGKSNRQENGFGSSGR